MIDGFWIRNFRSFKRLGIGSGFDLFSVVDGDVDVQPFELGFVTVFAGNCGVGKSAILDAFLFLTDCFYQGLDYACQKRGGLENILFQGDGKFFSIGIDFRQNENAETTTYAVRIGGDKNKVPFIESELLAIRGSEKSFPIIYLQNGHQSIRYLAPDESFTSADLTKIEFTDYNHLGLASLPDHPKYPIYALVRKTIENFVLAGITADPARGLDGAASRRQFSLRGQGLLGIVRLLVARHGDAASRLLERVVKFLPNVEEIILDATDPDIPRLAFRMDDLVRPIPIAMLSDATVRLLALALLLEEDHPAPLIAIEEPENGFDGPHLQQWLQLVRRVIDFPRPLQLFVTTHSPELFETIPSSNVWFLEKRAGEHIAERACDRMENVSTEPQS